MQINRWINRNNDLLKSLPWIDYIERFFEERRSRTKRTRLKTEEKNNFMVNLNFMA